jgi:hypothetical protein
MPARKPTDFVQFKLRVREDLRRRLEREANKQDHSTNNEAVLRLEQSFQDEDRLGGPELAAVMHSFNAEMEFVKVSYAEIGGDDALVRIAVAFRNVAEKLIPDLHSVKITRLKNDKGEEGRSAVCWTNRAKSGPGIDR